jgi:Reverse transcriptase (RNA-dependent DNA polymerase)
MSVLKKPYMLTSDPSSYRPLSNLPVVLKPVDYLVAGQLLSFLDSNQLPPPYQSVSQRGFSTETALTSVLSDLLDAVDRGNTTIVALLDLSAAFDMVGSPVHIFWRVRHGA